MAFNILTSFETYVLGIEAVYLILTLIEGVKKYEQYRG